MSVKHVLVVEDDPLLKGMYETILSDYVVGSAITVVGNGSEALEVFRSQSWALVITDLNMPGLSGRDLDYRAREVCERESMQLPPFLFCSGVSGALDGVDSICEMPGNVRILKPFSMMEFQETVERLLAGQ